MNQTVARLEPRWTALLTGLKPHSPGSVFREIVEAYTSPTRFYHNLEHIEHVLLTIENLKPLARNDTALQLAAWFHDLVYESRNSDNEELSAARAEEILSGWYASPALRIKVVSLIMATKKHQAAADDVDAQILLDADLAILSEDAARYQAYAQAIRQEYAWVSDIDFRTGRSRVLENFLKRERIYFTAPMQAREGRARENLQAELESLRKSSAG